VIPEAPLRETEYGLIPDGEGWFVVNTKEARWWQNDAFGFGCTWEDEDRPFAEFGINIQVLEPGKPNCMYHGEEDQEDMLVLSGECLLLVEGEERRLRAWDFVHFPPGTEHIVVGAGSGPCVVLMAGARSSDPGLHYPRSELALARGAGAEAETDDPREAYASYERPQPGRPKGWDALPWGR